MSKLVEIFTQKKADFAQQGIQIPESGSIRDVSDSIRHMISSKPFHNNSNTDISSQKRRIISEIKMSSPSLGEINHEYKPEEIAIAYASGGASAISVLTEKHFFAGSLSFLQQVRKKVELPLLRKDFLFHPAQVEESFVWGADGILLIASYLSGEEMDALLREVRRYSMWALVEIHDESEIDSVFRLKNFSPEIDLFGINNRNLHSLALDRGHGLRLLQKYNQEIRSRGMRFVAESGFNSTEDFKDYDGLTFAYLIGSSIMQSGDLNQIKAKVSSLVST